MRDRIPLDDTRLEAFSKHFPGTTHEAILFLAELLWLAERRGQETAIDNLGEALEERIAEAVKTRTKELLEMIRQNHSVMTAARDLASHYRRFEEDKERAQAAMPGVVK